MKSFLRFAESIASALKETLREVDVIYFIIF